MKNSVGSARMGMRMRIAGYYVQLGNVVYTASRSTESLPPSLSFVMAGPCAAFGRTPSFSGSCSPHLLVGCEPSTSAPEHLEHLELPTISSSSACTTLSNTKNLQGHLSTSCLIVQQTVDLESTFAYILPRLDILIHTGIHIHQHMCVACCTSLVRLL